MRFLLVSFSLALLAFVCSGCAKILSFDIQEDIPSQSVQGSVLGSLLPSGILSFPLTVDLKTEEQAHGTGPVSTVTLESLTLTITSPSTQTWDFLNSITVSIASSQSGSTLPTVEIAKLASVSSGQTTLSITPTPDVNLVPYIHEGAQITSTVTGHEPSQDTSFNGKITLHAHL